MEKEKNIKAFFTKLLGTKNFGIVIIKDLNSEFEFIVKINNTEIKGFQIAQDLIILNGVELARFFNNEQNDIEITLGQNTQKIMLKNILLWN